MNNIVEASDRTDLGVLVMQWSLEVILFLTVFEIAINRKFRETND